MNSLVYTAQYANAADSLEITCSPSSDSMLTSMPHWFSCLSVPFFLISEGLIVWKHFNQQSRNDLKILPILGYAIFVVLCWSPCLCQEGSGPVIYKNIASFWCLNGCPAPSAQLFWPLSFLSSHPAEETLHLCPLRPLYSYQYIATMPVLPSHWWKMTPVIYSVMLGSHNGPLKRLIWATNLWKKQHFDWLLAFDHMRSFISNNEY